MWGGSIAVAQDEEPQFCTQQYDPVCGVKNGERRTFSNACFARIEGYRVTRQGECRGKGQGAEHTGSTNNSAKQFAPGQQDEPANQVAPGQQDDGNARDAAPGRKKKQPE
jgi:hypothetical protein